MIKMKKITKIVLFPALLMTILGVNFALGYTISFGEEILYSDELDVWVQTPTIVGFEDSAYGVCKFPIYVEADAFSHWDGGEWCVPRKISIEVWAQDDNRAASWITHGSRDVLSSEISGSSWEITYTLGVKNFGIKWQYQTTDVISNDYDPLSASSYSWKKVGIVEVDSNNAFETSQISWGIVFNVHIPNGEARVRSGSHMVFRVKVSVEYQKYCWWWWPSGVKTESFTPYIGNGYPSSDAYLYLTEINDWTTNVW